MDRFCRARIHPGQDLAAHDETLFSEHVRFVGDRVAAVVATSRATAEAAAALVEIEYEELPPLLTVDEALASTDVLVHSTGNVAYEHEIDKGERPDLEGAVIVSSVDQHASRPPRRARAPRLHRPGPQHRRHDRLDHEPGRVRRAHRHRGAPRHGVPPRARHQGAHGRVLRRQDRVHHRAGLRLPRARHAPARQAAPRPRGVHGRDHGPPGHLDDHPHRLHAGRHAARLRGGVHAGRRRLRVEHARLLHPHVQEGHQAVPRAALPAPEPGRAHEHAGRGRRSRLGRPGDGRGHRDPHGPGGGRAAARPGRPAPQEHGRALRHRPRDRPAARRRARARVPRARRRGLRLGRAPGPPRRAGSPAARRRRGRRRSQERHVRRLPRGQQHVAEDERGRDLRAQRQPARGRAAAS